MLKCASISISIVFVNLKTIHLDLYSFQFYGSLQSIPFEQILSKLMEFANEFHITSITKLIGPKYNHKTLNYINFRYLNYINITTKNSKSFI